MNASLKIIQTFVAAALLVLPGVLFAQTQSPCAGTVSISDTSQLPPGALFVLTNSVQANFTVTGPKTYQGNGSFAEQNVPPGTYTITYGAVAGCETPPQETKTTDTKGSITFTANYKDLSKPKGYGMIEVRTNLNQPATIKVSGPDTRTVQGTSFSWLTAPVGTYTVIYGDVKSYVTPSPETQTLEVGGIINFYGTYKPEEGNFLTVQSGFPGTTRVYFDEIFAGTAPVTKKMPYGKEIKIRCSLDGYEDYVHVYPASAYSPESPRGESTLSCLMRAKGASEEKTVPAQPKNQESGTSPKNLEEQQELPALVPASPHQPPAKSFFRKIGNAISSFFSKLFSIFSRRPSAPLPSSTIPEVRPPGYELQGLWKIERLYTPDAKGNWKEETIQPSQKEKYTEFKDNQVCLEGNLDSDGAPIPCANHTSFTVSGDTIAIAQANDFTMSGTWKVAGGKLELNLTIAKGSDAQKLRAIFTKFDRPFSAKPAPQAVPAEPLREVVPAEQMKPSGVATPSTPTASLPPAKNPTPQELQGIWMGVASGGYGDAYYVEFRDEGFCPYGITAGPDIVACSAATPTVSGYVPFLVDLGGDIHFPFRGQNFVWQASIEGNKLTITKKSHDIREGFEGKLEVKALSAPRKEVFTKYTQP